MGEYHVGVRCDDAAMLDELASRYRGRLVSEDRGEADFGLSVHEAPQPSGSRLLPSLVHGRQPILRSRNVDRLVRRLAVQLGALEFDPVPGAIPLTRVGALVSNGRAVLLPEHVLGVSASIERIAARAGAAIAEPVGLSMRLGNARSSLPSLVIAPPLDGTDVNGGAAPGDYELVGWAYEPDGLQGRSRRALDLARSLRHMVGAATGVHVDASVLTQLSGTLDMTFTTTLTSETRPELDWAIALLEG